MTKFCPNCGEKLTDDAKFCKSCGKSLEGIANPISDDFKMDIVEQNHNLAIVSGYILSIIIPLFGVIAAIYLLTRKDSQKAFKHGKIILVIALIIWFLSAITIFL